MVTAVEAFILTAVGILVLSLTVYSCIALRFFILKHKKRNIERAELEAEKVKEENERKEKQKRRKLFEEFKSEAIESGAVKNQPRKKDEY